MNGYHNAIAEMRGPVFLLFYAVVIGRDAARMLACAARSRLDGAMPAPRFRASQTRTILTSRRRERSRALDHLRARAERAA